jgi:putative acetyltransferase
MHVRELRPGEEPILFGLFRNTIRRVNVRDYSESQVVAWAPDDLDPSVWAEKMRSIRPFVVEVEENIVGYSDLQSDGLVDHFFVHHEWQRCGVGRVLMSEIETRAFSRRIDHLETHASITARPFFEAVDFVVVREQELEMRGERLKNYVMRRDMQRA